MTPKIKKTKRLILRPLALKDFKIWEESELLKLPKKNMWDSHPRSLESVNLSEFKKIIKVQKEQRLKDEYYDYAIFHKKTGEIIGRVSAMNVIRSVTQSSFLGYFINNNHWGRGYGSEAVRGFVDVAFKELKLHRLEAGIEPTNKRSIRLIKSLGFRREGVKKRIVHLRGEWKDAVIYSATCEDFNIKFKGEISSRKP